MVVSSINLQGLQQASAELETAAARIAGGNPPDAAPAEAVDLSAEMVALMSAQILFEANIAGLKTSEQMQKSLIDVTA